MRIIDCFTFYNEIDLLNYRLILLAPYVDYFVLVEANQTHMGNEKILYYKEYLEKYNQENKIINITIDLPHKANEIKDNNQWLNENFQRNAIKLGLSQLNCEPNDIIIISDLDEIIDPNILKNIRENKLKIQDGYSLEQDFYYYNLTTKHMDKWYYSKIIKYSELKNKSPQKIRFTKYPILRKLFISKQSDLLTDILVFISVSITEIGSNSQLIYNSSSDYKDLSLDEQIQLISNRIIVHDSVNVLPFKQNTSIITPYETVVEPAFNVFANAMLKNITESNDTDTPYADFHILAKFSEYIATYFQSTLAPLMSIEDLRIHLEILKLHFSIMSGVRNKLSVTLKQLYILNKYDTNHPLYKSMGDLIAALDASVLTKLKDTNDYIERILIQHLENNISNTVDDYAVLSTKCDELKDSYILLHATLTKVFVDASSGYAIAPALIE